jgi:tripartite-type tricarboxylate transporter receptor subunit TctC
MIAIRIRALLVIAAGLLSLLCAAEPAAAADRVLRVIVPTPAGTSADLMARILAEHMAPSLGAVLVVENKPGASGAIAVEAMLQGGAPALLVAGLDHILYGPAALGRKPWDPLTDFKPVGLVNNDRWVIVGHPATAGDLQSLLRTARDRPLRCANAGLGTTQHAVCAWVGKRLGVDVDHVPYSQAFLPDLIGGRVDIAAMPVPGASAALSGGRVMGVMLLSRERHPSFPSIPTSLELHPPGIIFESGLALYAAPGMADREVDQVHEALQRAESDVAVRKRFAELGVDPAAATRAESLQQLRVRIRLNDEIRLEALGKAR